ncbi:hypothetical protein CHLNCDRAFT_57826 [Chlorella variabilis]|uniref:Calcineurin-like phosphoesterase domain-containing protein n=1 Tax=Chlorella variabilis TaxID=554065 RepID=E1ZFB0_CHLVA|nr:hypothetical protein CHLNCDRAFT_57826 [Chlorella variabilis]EFN55639.1 hypothetical protein CHLNCDRAFT_57826 [Chlorella variabilis]|eukprot:XP_005847741.1 hypothetical protein CHLNCDRAFT_57826 [Chlorella variabilis]
MASAPRTLTILHFNDCYDIEARQREPVGGAARMAAKIRTFGPTALVLHSGDVFNPSMLSTITQGKQMVEVLNCCAIRACCVGNHDLDYGVENFQQRASECSFPWLMANVLDVQTGAPLGGAAPSVLLDWQGIKVGLVGLVEQEWLTTLASVDADEVTYLDFVQEGERLAAQLREQGAELVVALTHMRLPNDMRLAREAPGIDLVLGGHDHDCFLLRSEPHGTVVVKSGTDFQDLTEIKVTLTPAGADPLDPSAHAVPPPSPGAHRACVPGLVGTPVGSPRDGAASPRGATSPRADGAGAAVPVVPAPAVAVYEAAADASLATSLRSCRPVGNSQPGGGPTIAVRCLRHTITSDVPEDAEVAAIVERYKQQMGERMGVVGPNRGEQSGQLCVRRVAGGLPLRHRIHPAGELTHRDLVSILPMLDETVVIQVSGAQLLEALENGVYEWPKLEGRFPQVSGIRFVFDTSQPPGQRIVADSVMVGGEPLDPGYEALMGSQLLCDCDCTPLLPTVVMNHFMVLRMANRYMENTGRVPAWRRAADRLLKSSELYATRSQQRLEEAGVSHIARKHPATGHWEVAPVLDGRIRRLGSSDRGSDASGCAAVS